MKGYISFMPFVYIARGYKPQTKCNHFPLLCIAIMTTASRFLHWRNHFISKFHFPRGNKKKRDYNVSLLSYLRTQQLPDLILQVWSLHFFSFHFLFCSIFFDVRYLEAEANKKLHKDIVGLLVDPESLKVRALV